MLLTNLLGHFCSEFSKQLNESRIKVLQAKEGSVHGLVKDAHKQLLAIASNKKQYKSLLTDLTVQVSKIQVK